MHRILQLRRKLGLSQSEFADLLNISKGNLAMSEIGKRKLNTNSALLLAKIEQELENYAPPEPEMNSREEKEINTYARLCKARINRLEVELEKRKDEVEAKHRMLYLCQRLDESSFLPDEGYIYDRIALLKRQKSGQAKSSKKISETLIRIQIAGLQRELELCQTRNF
jgi:transcriptional regulator with XRE-family HTH domain